MAKDTSISKATKHDLDNNSRYISKRVRMEGEQMRGKGCPDLQSVNDSMERDGLVAAADGAPAEVSVSANNQNDLSW